MHSIKSQVAEYIFSIKKKRVIKKSEQIIEHMRQTVYCPGKILFCCVLACDMKEPQEIISGLRYGEYGCSLGIKFTRKLEGNSVQILHSMGKYPNNMWHV